MKHTRIDLALMQISLLGKLTERRTAETVYNFSECVREVVWHCVRARVLMAEVCTPTVTEAHKVHSTTTHGAGAVRTCPMKPLA